MSDILVTVASVTSAVRLEKLLKKYGDKKARVINTPAELAVNGCSYSVLADLPSEKYIRSVPHGIIVTGIYIDEAAGGEHFYHDIS